MKNQIERDILAPFIASLNNCQTAQDLLEISKNMMQEVTAIVKPRHNIHFRALLQDMGGVDPRLDQGPLDEQVDLWIQKLTEVISARGRRARELIIELDIFRE